MTSQEERIEGRAVPLERRSLPEQLRFLARKLLDGGDTDAVALTLQVIADEQRDAARDALASLAAELDREADAAITDVGEAALRFSARKARQNAQDGSGVPNTAPPVSPGVQGAQDRTEPHSAAQAADAGRERCARHLEALAANYPADVFPPTGTSRDAIGGSAMRHALTNAARSLREDELREPEGAS